MESVLKKSKSRINNWWVALLIGILFILIGFWTISTPVQSYLSLVIVFASFMFVSGIFQLVFSINNRKEIDNWGWHFTGALFDFVVGCILFFNPAITMVVLPFIMGFYFMFKGFATFGFAFDLKNQGSGGWGWLLASGILSVIFSIMILSNPTLGGLTIVIFTAMAFFSLGFFNITLAFSLKKIKDKAEDAKVFVGNLKEKLS
jgi:uncharacterized membrane protein HdeD (DUF308 family)